THIFIYIEPEREREREREDKGRKIFLVIDMSACVSCSCSPLYPLNRHTRTVPSSRFSSSLPRIYSHFHPLTTLITMKQQQYMPTRRRVFAPRCYDDDDISGITTEDADADEEEDDDVVKEEEVEGEGMIPLPEKWDVVGLGQAMVDFSG